MTDVIQTFDAGTPGNAVVAGVNGVTAIVEGTPVYAAGLHGIAAIRAGGPADTNNARFRVSLGMSGNHYGSIYLKNTTSHGSETNGVNFFHLVAANLSFIAQFRAMPNNALSIRVVATEVRVGSSGDLPINAWFRLDWQMTGTTFNWRIFYAPEGTTHNLSGSIDTSAVASPAESLLLGTQSTFAIIKDWSFDTFRATNTGTWFAPYAPAPEGPSATVWDGSDELPAVVSLWDGSAEDAISALEVTT